MTKNRTVGNMQKLNILVLIENPQSLRQTMAWFNLLGHHTKLCDDRNVFLDELTKSEIEYDLVFVDVTEANLMPVLESIQLSHALNVYDVTRKKVKCVLYGNVELNSVYKQAVSDAQATYISRTTNQIEFFEALSNALELPSGTGNEWNTELEQKLSKGANNVVQLRP